MEIITAQILEDDTILFDDVQIEIDVASRSGSFALPPQKWLSARSFIIKAADGRSVEVLPQNKTFAAMGDAVQHISFIFASGSFD
jgi:hypothetical protein